MTNHYISALILLLFIVIANAAFQYKLSKADHRNQFKSAIMLRYPLLKSSSIEMEQLFKLYLPTYENNSVFTYLAVNCASREVIAALDVDPKTLVILNLTVQQNFRRLGIATALLNHCFEAIRRIKGNSDCELSLLVENHNLVARKLYESVGFQLKPGTPSFYLYPICPPILITFCKTLANRLSLRYGK